LVSSTVKMTPKPRIRQTLTTRQFAQSLGVSESSVKRWIDDGMIDADRTAGGHRRIPIASAVRFMRLNRMSPQHPEVLPLTAVPSIGAVDLEAVDEFYEAFVADDAERVRAIMTGRYMSGADIASIGDGLVRPTLERLGELWKHDPQGILVEHRAIEICIRALTELVAWLPPIPPGAPTAVTAAGPEDPYLLSPMLASMVLLEQGIQVRNLGPSTPLETIDLATLRYGAIMCSVSVGIVQVRHCHAAWIRLADRLGANQIKLIVGGRCVGTLPNEFLSRVRVCSSMIELGSYAAGVVGGVNSARELRDGVDL
jgi:MerR family transcriptional regulator, light-induced transcriptional regulator